MAIEREQHFRISSELRCVRVAGAERAQVGRCTGAEGSEDERERIARRAKAELQAR